MEDIFSRLLLFCASVLTKLYAGVYTVKNRRQRFIITAGLYLPEMEFVMKTDRMLLANESKFFGFSFSYFYGYGFFGLEKLNSDLQS